MDAQLSHGLAFLNNQGIRCEESDRHFAGRLANQIEAAFRITTWPGTTSVPQGRLLWWSEDVAARWTGHGWTYLTRPLDSLPLLTAVSSRLSQPWTSHTRWMTHLRQSVALSESSCRWLIGSGTTTAPWLEHLCRRWQRSTLHVDTPPHRMTFSNAWTWWLRKVEASNRPTPVLIVAPPTEASSCDNADPTPALAPADRWLFALSDGLFCLYRRPGGAIEELWRRREREGRSGRWQIAFDGPEQPWPMWDAGEPMAARAHIVGRLPWPALCHWTRACDTAWPDEDNQLWRDRVLLLSDAARHGAWEALLKILRDGRLLGSTRGVRGSTPMVSWTQQPLERWPELRVFRPGRRKWDFELYGVAVRRDHVRRHGGRPVWYGEEADFRSASPEERPYGQLRRSRQASIDWRAEREWRSPGDFRFDGLPTSDIVVFVPHYWQAARLAAEFPYRVYLVREGNRSREGRRSE